MLLTVLLSLVAVTLGGPTPPNPRVEFRSESRLDGDGRHWVGLTRSKRLVVWDAATGKAIHVLEGYRQPIDRARLFPDGRSVLGQSYESQSDGVNEKGPRDRSIGIDRPLLNPDSNGVGSCLDSGTFKIAWLPQSIGFVAYCDRRWLTYRPGVGLLKRGEADLPTPRHRGAPFIILVSPEERNFAACYSTDEADGTTTLTTVGYDVKACRKLWEQPGRGVKFSPNGELIVEDGDAVLFVEATSGVSKRTIRLEGLQS